MNFVLFWLSIEIKHFVADFLLQTDWMYEGKRREKCWFAFLIIHSAIVAYGTFLIVWYLTGVPVCGSAAFFIDLFLHASIDRVKLFVETFSTPLEAQVIDQLLHQATYLLIYLLFF